MTKVQFESAAFNKPKINFCGPDSEDDRDGVASENILTQLRAKLAAKEEMLNEAVLEYHLKSEETEKILLENAQLKQELAESSNEIINLQVRNEIDLLFQSNANSQIYNRLSWKSPIFSCRMQMRGLMSVKMNWSI